MIIFRLPSVFLGDFSGSQSWEIKRRQSHPQSPKKYFRRNEGFLKGTATVLIGAGISASLRELHNIC